MKKPFRGIAPLIITVLIFIFVSVIIAEKGENTAMQYSQLISEIQEGNIEKIVLSSDGGTATVKQKEEKREKTVNEHSQIHNNPFGGNSSADGLFRPKDD